MSFFKRLFKLGKEKEFSIASTMMYGDTPNPEYLKALECNLLPGEIILLDWLKDKQEGRPFPDYFYLLYGLEPEKSIRKLLTLKLIQYSSPKDSLNALTVGDLKEMLEGIGLKKTGKKSELIERLADSFTDDELRSVINVKSYSTTLKGESLLEEYEYLVRAHKSSGFIDVLSAIDCMKHNDITSYKADIDIKLGLYKLKIALQNKRFYDIGTPLLYIARTNRKLKKYKDSRIAYLCSFISDVSGWSGLGYTKSDFINSHSVVFVPEEAKDLLDCDSIQVYFDEAWGVMLNVLPAHYLGRDKSYECLIAALNDDIDRINELCELSAH